MHISRVSDHGPESFIGNGFGNLISWALHHDAVKHMMHARSVSLCLSPFAKVSVINCGLQIYCFYFVRVYYFVKFARIRKSQNAMKKSYILLFAAVVLTVTGCDFFRKLAGRPTSDVIEVKRQEMVADLEAKAAREKAIQDSLDLIAKHEADSVEAWRFIEENDVRIYPASDLGGIVEDGLKEFSYYEGTRYRIIVGSFKDKANADKMVAKVWEAGEAMDLWAHQIRMRNGMIAVAVRPNNRIQNAIRGIDDLKNCGICPPDVWILKIE